jgi:ketosteroid isomerase-like protein
MKRVAIVVLAIGVVAAAGIANAQQNEPRVADDEKEELIRLQQEWCRAELSRDTAALSRLLADDYALVTPEGEHIPRDQLLREIGADGLRVISIPAEKLNVQVYGTAAVVRGLAKWSDGSATTGQSVFTDTWVKREGKWKCVATHESGSEVTEEPSPELKDLEPFVGDFSYQGEQFDTPVADLPFGGAGKYSGRGTTRFILDMGWRAGPICGVC